MNQCPTAEQLEKWLQQPADGPEFGALALHVDECPRCQVALERLTAPGGQPLPCGPREPAPAADSATLGHLKRVLPIQAWSTSGTSGDTPGRTGEGMRGDGPLNAPPAAALAQSDWSGSTPRLKHEIRALLQRRLRVFSVVAAVLFTALLIFFLSDRTPAEYKRFGDWLGGTLVTATALAAWGCAVAVWARPTLTLRSLRLLELLLFGVIVVFCAKFRYTSLTRGLEGTWEGPRHQALFLMQIHLINNMFSYFTIVCYGVFVPNTWRRCVAVVAFMLLVPLAITIAAGLQNETVKEKLPTLLTYMSLGMLICAAVAVFGSFKISTLQREAFVARQLGHYRLKERLGAGGMGEVYLAEHQLLKRPCAVKLIRPERASDPKLLQRFEREVQATAQLRHVNTVEIFDYGHAEDGTFYYVMEYLPGLGLDELVTRHGRQPAGRVVHLLRQLCGALREAHDAGLLHRDIKPSNIILCKHGGLHDVAKLLDFGLVRSLHLETSEGTKLTTEGLILGTPDFMSPEQANGAADLSVRSDLYSLGAVAYFLLSGRPPFAGKTALETLAAHLHLSPAPLTDYFPDVPADLQAIVLRCLAKDPGERFADAESLDQALGQCACAGQWTEVQARRWWQLHGGEATPVNTGTKSQTDLLPEQRQQENGDS